MSQPPSPSRSPPTQPCSRICALRRCSLRRFVPRQSRSLLWRAAADSRQTDSRCCWGCCLDLREGQNGHARTVEERNGTSAEKFEHVLLCPRPFRPLPMRDRAELDCFSAAVLVLSLPSAWANATSGALTSFGCPLLCVCACACVPLLRQVSSMLRLKFGGYVRPLRPEPLEVLAKEDSGLSDIDFCYAVLNKVRHSAQKRARRASKGVQRAKNAVAAAAIQNCAHASV